MKFLKQYPVFFFTKIEKERIFSAIREAEKNTSGEIRIHLERHVKGDILEHAKKVFERIGMTKTKDRNGVLILLALSDKQFAVLGDKGIDEKVPANFWNDVAGTMREHFRQGRFAEGIAETAQRIGIKLKEYFPYQAGDRNELPDEISH